MFVKKLLQLVALSTTLCAQANNITFRNVNLRGDGFYIRINESNSLSEYLPKTIVSKITVRGWFPVLYENSVSNITNVEKLDFFANGIEEIQPGAFKNFEGVKTLVITKCRLVVIKKGTFEDLPLEQLDLSDNKIEKIDAGAFANLPNLKELLLKENRIEQLQSDAFDGLSLKRLVLSNNLFSTIPGNFFKNLKLQEIYLQFTKLTTIPGGVFTNNPHLKKVVLSWNGILSVESDAFDNMPNLEGITFNINNLTKIDPQWFHNSSNIHQLDFGRNSIEEIPNEAFKNIIKGNFTKINFYHNRISRISPGAFEGVRRIQNLVLSLNAFDKWDGSFLENVEIDTLDLSFNEIKCPEGNLNDVFKAYVTLLYNSTLDDECLRKIDEWNKVHSPKGRKVCTHISDEYYLPDRSMTAHLCH